MSPIPFGDVDDSVAAVGEAITMIIVSEIGDKTFLIAAILAMRHARLAVFLGAFGSLVLMSVLSAALGRLLPTLVPLAWAQLAAAVLFVFFGVRMFGEARGMESGRRKIEDELREVEEEIAGDEEGVLMDDLEGGGGGGGGEVKGKVVLVSQDLNRWTEGARNFCSLFLGPVFVQAFVLTFLGEWGDRSQISTIALAASHVRLLFFFFLGVGLLTPWLFFFRMCISWRWGLFSATRFVRRWRLSADDIFPRKYQPSIVSRPPLVLFCACAHSQIPVTYGGSILFLVFGIIYLHGALAAHTDVITLT